MRVYDLSSTQDTEFDDEGEEIEAEEARFPEDSLAHIEFTLVDSENKRHVCKYEDFEIRQPEDQWCFEKDKKKAEPLAPGKLLVIDKGL